MFTRILVPLDGGSLSERALNVAAPLARASSGALLLLSVVAPPIRHEFGEYDAWSAETVDENVGKAERYLDHVSGLPALEGVPEVKTKVAMGSPAQAVLEAISSQKADLVVMTSRGRSGLSRWLLGSVSHHVVRYATAPVLLLHDQAWTLASSNPDLEHLFRVLVSLDGSAHAETAVAPAAELASLVTGRGEAGLHLLLVVSPYEAANTSMPEALIVDGAKGYLGRIADRLWQEYPRLTVTWSVGVGLDIAETIIRVAENGEDVEGAGVFGGCDVLAMATHGRTGIARWSMGSVTERVPSATRRPMLIIRPPQLDQK
jgi:nucleotide-binding universal stress UspA family protein